MSENYRKSKNKRKKRKKRRVVFIDSSDDSDDLESINDFSADDDGSGVGPGLGSGVGSGISSGRDSGHDSGISSYNSSYNTNTGVEASTSYNPRTVTAVDIEPLDFIIAELRDINSGIINKNIAEKREMIRKISPIANGIHDSLTGHMSKQISQMKRDELEAENVQLKLSNSLLIIAVSILVLIIYSRSRASFTGGTRKLLLFAIVGAFFWNICGEKKIKPQIAGKGYNRNRLSGGDQTARYRLNYLFE